MKSFSVLFAKKLREEGQRGKRIGFWNPSITQNPNPNPKRLLFIKKSRSHFIMVVSTPFIANVAQQVLRNLPTIISGARQAYSAYQSMSRSRPSRVSRSSRSVRTVASVRRALSARRTPMQRLRRSIRRSTRRSRRVTRRPRRRVSSSRFRRPNPNKASQRMRLYNRAPLSLNRMLSQGVPLPRTTFAKMRFMSTRQIAFGNLPVERRSRVLCMNSIADHWIHGMQDINRQGGTWQYLDMYKAMYMEYMILGAKTQITIKPAIHVPVLNAVSTFNDVNTVCAPSYEGYYYVRVHYSRSDGSPVGRVITHDGVFTENWRSLQQFKADPTITFFKDKGVSKRYKTGYVLDAAGLAAPQEALPISLAPQNNRFYVEYENYNKEVRMSVSFSAKKHFQEQNILRNGTWAPFDNSLPQDRSFMVFVGYIAFSPENNYFTVMPIDRQLFKSMTVDTTVYVGLQSPNISPTTGFLPDQAMRNIDQEEIEHFNYAITRNQDTENPELEKELLEEIDNMIEEAEEESDHSESDRETLEE